MVPLKMQKVPPRTFCTKKHFFPAQANTHLGLRGGSPARRPDSSRMTCNYTDKNPKTHNAPTPPTCGEQGTGEGTGARLAWGKGTLSRPPKTHPEALLKPQSSRQHRPTGRNAGMEL